MNVLICLHECFAIYVLLDFVTAVFHHVEGIVANQPVFVLGRHFITHML